jgi:multidrug efflux pump subunit AcrB
MLGSVLALYRLKIDIFPTLNLPVIYVCQPYGGMDARDMEGMITNYFEYHFLYVSGIHHVESRNIQGMSLMKLYFHPGTDMAQAMGETVAAANRSRAMMPPGTVPPFITRFDTGSVPVGYLVLSSTTRSITEIQDQAIFRVRPIFANLPGVSTPPPFGGNARAIVVNLDPDRLRAHDLSPDQVLAAVQAGNTIAPAGNVRLGDRYPTVPTNGIIGKPEELGAIPVKPGQELYLRDIVVRPRPGSNDPSGIADASDIATGCALVNGRRAVYMLVTKRAEASSVAVVNEVKKNLRRMQDAIDADIRVSFEFDQTPMVTGAMSGVALEAGLGAILTGLMVLVFLRDWRSVIVVVLNIPLALMAAIIAIWVCGHTLNLMTLGGLALAVGILVDEATVEVENIHTQMDHTPSIARAVRLGNLETAVPRLLAMLCILAVFIPSLFMEGAIKSLFVPLSLAVGFSMIASYFLSSTFVPVMSVLLLRRSHSHAATPATKTSWLGATLAGIVSRIVGLRWVMVPSYFAAAAVLIAITWRGLGTEVFPAADTGTFQLRLRTATGTHFERTEEMTREALAVIEEISGGQVAMSLGYVGTFPSSYPVQAIYQWNGGPEEAVVRIAMKRGSGLRMREFQARLRRELPGKLDERIRAAAEKEGLSAERLAERLSNVRLSFEAADIINEVMSFGFPTPIQIDVSSPKMADNRAYAAKLRQRLAQVPGLTDVHYVQSLDYPTIEIQINREMASRAGYTARDVARALVPATSSTRILEPVMWRDPNNGIGYLIQVQLPPSRVQSVQDLAQVPLPHQRGQGSARGAMVGDVAVVGEGEQPGEIGRYNMRRTVSISANIQGTDLGSVARDVRKAIAEVGAPPRGVQVDIRGQVDPLEKMFGGLSGTARYSARDYFTRLESWRYALEGLTLGLGLAVIAIMLMLTAYFQSLRLALTAVAAVPAVIAGSVIMLVLTGTTLNIQSFMGMIMAIGVAIANAILLVTFAEKSRRELGDAREGAVAGVRTRVRPILMTSGAMLAGMMPMALGFGEGGTQTAPLGRAVIGGLMASTLTTLLILPAVFALFMGWASTRAASLDPDDPASRHYDPAGV